MRIHRFARFGPFSCSVEFLNGAGSNFGTPRIVVARIDDASMPAHDVDGREVVEIATSVSIQKMEL